MNDNNNMINNERNVNPLNINTNDISNNNDNSTPLKKVYSNMTSSSQSRKLSSLEEKLSTINSPPDIENYYKSLKTENQGVIPQINRMELLQRKINLLQNSSNQNSKSLQEILELEMNERLRYPKYTIIQNTPLTPHEEIVNEILKKKFGPGGGYSMNYPTVVFKNQEEINEMRNKQNLKNLNNNNTNNNNAVGNKVTFQSNENRPITVKMLKEIQQEILNLRKALSELKIGFKEMKEQLKIMKSEDEHKNTLMIEMIRKIIENGGDTKLKASMESVFDKKKIDLSKIKTDLEGFKEEELTDIIKNEIKIYDEEKDIIISKQIEELKKMINENKILNNNDNNDNNKIEGFEDFLKIEEKEKIESRKESKNQTNKGTSKNKKDDEEKSGSKSKNAKSKKRKKKRKNKKRSKNATSSNEEEEDEESENESENESDEEEENETSEGNSKSTKTKKTNKKTSKNSGTEEEEEEDDESESNEESESKASKTSKRKKKSKYNKNSTSKSKNTENNEEDEDSKNSHTESESHSGSKSKSRTFTTKGNKSKSKKSNNKKMSKKSETIDERESEDDGGNDSSNEEKSKSTQKKSQKNNTKSSSKK